jgi:hypothetical protein
LSLLLASIAALLTAGARAQQTNVSWPVPLTRIEALETNRGTVLIKGTTTLGTAPGRIGAVSVRCKEVIEAGTGRKEYGLAIELTSPEGYEETTLVDYEELDPLLGAIDYLNKVDWSITSLSSFDAAFTTKAGLRVSAFSARRTDTIEFAVRSSRTSSLRVLLAREHMAQLRGLLDQGKRTLESISRTGR